MQTGKGPGRSAPDSLQYPVVSTLTSTGSLVAGWLPLLVGSRPRRLSSLSRSRNERQGPRRNREYELVANPFATLAALPVTGPSGERPRDLVRDLVAQNVIARAREFMRDGLHRH
jgi:hypothetical protein